MVLSGISDWLASVESAAQSVGQWTGSAINSGLANFRAQVSAFKSLWNKVYALKPNASWPADLRDDYATLLSDAASINEKVNWIEVQISKAMSAVGLSGLGVLPAVVPAVVVTAILALAYLITRWTDAATRFIERAQYVKAREADGVSPAAAINEFNAKNPVSTGLSGDIARIVWPLAIGAAALYLLKNRK